MLLRQAHTARGRRGSAIVEAALSLTVFCLLLFGVFEYCRYLFVLHVTDLAAREAVRYASVNTDKPSDFDVNNYKAYKNIIAYTKDRLAGADKQIVGYTATVFPVDSTALTQTPPVVQAKTGFGVAGSGVYWNTASFPDRLAVKITGTFKPFLPSLTQMPTLPVNVVALSGVEG
ncbi:MAG: pilus assembly protein [Planctomycetes bacterium]|nr:pilus assembly protein [Planctomycetota bacterium]